MAPRAMGRKRVRDTWGSRFRSHKSLMLHPAPRMIRAPVKNKSEVDRTDVVIEVVYDAAINVEKKQGKNK